MRIREAFSSNVLRYKRVSYIVVEAFPVATGIVPALLGKVKGKIRAVKREFKTHWTRAMEIGYLDISVAFHFESTHIKRILSIRMGPSSILSKQEIRFAIGP